MTVTTMTIRRLRWLAVLMAFGLLAAACGGDDDDSSTTAAAEPTADGVASGDDSDGGLTVTAVVISTGTVTIVNNGAADVDLSGHQLCNRPTYVPLPSQTLAPGERIDVSVGGLSATGGEAGLYTSGDFANSDDLVSYVTWGSGGGRLSVAEAGGTWSGDPIGEPGDTLTLSGDPGSAAGWSG